MARSSKLSWLEGPGDLEEADVEDVPVKGESVRVSGLAAQYSNQASSEALELKTIGTEQIATVNTARLEVLQFAHGCVEPEFTEAEAEQISQRFGPAFKKVIAEIDRLSGVNKEEIENTQARFPTSNGASASPDDAKSGDARPGADVAAGSGESDVRVRAGAPDENAPK